MTLCCMLTIKIQLDFLMCCILAISYTFVLSSWKQVLCMTCHCIAKLENPGEPEKSILMKEKNMILFISH